MDDIKWYMIGMAVIMVSMFASFAYTDHQKAQCNIAAIEAKMPVDQIEKVCK